MRATRWSTVLCGALVLPLSAGCGPTFRDHRAMGREQFHSGHLEAARSHYTAAHDMVPEHADNLCDLGRCHVEIARRYLERDDQRAARREMDHAINYYDRALQTFPGYQRALRGKNEALEMRGRPADALATARWASSVTAPTIQHQLFLAEEYAERGDADQALLAYRQAVAMAPDDPSAHWAIAQFYLQLDRPGDAIPHLQEAYRLDPSRTYAADELRRLNARVPVDLSRQG